MIGPYISVVGRMPMRVASRTLVLSVLALVMPCLLTCGCKKKKRMTAAQFFEARQKRVIRNVQLKTVSSPYFAFSPYGYTIKICADDYLDVLKEQCASGEDVTTLSLYNNLRRLRQEKIEQVLGNVPEACYCFALLDLHGFLYRGQALVICNSTRKKIRHLTEKKTIDDDGHEYFEYFASGKQVSRYFVYAKQTSL